MASKSFLSTLEVFKNVPLSQWPEVEKKMVEKRYQKGQTLFLEGDPADFVWFIKEGHVKAVIHSSNGKDLTLCMVGGGSMFGTCCCFGGGHHPCHTVAETDATVVTYPMPDFLTLLEKNPDLSKAVVTQLSQRLRQAKDMQTFDQEPVEKRILHVLVNLVAEFGNTIPLTRREIAEMTGTTVETCIRTFSALEKAGLVSGSRGKITIKDVQGLVGRMGEN
jgi:CRP-like cAMP-binding protein